MIYGQSLSVRVCLIVRIPAGQLLPMVVQCNLTTIAEQTVRQHQRLFSPVVRSLSSLITLRFLLIGEEFAGLRCILRIALERGRSPAASAQQRPKQGVRGVVGMEGMEMEGV